jgi:hypothetical protein
MISFSHQQIAWLLKMRGCIQRFNARVNASAFGRFFQLEERGSNFTTELRGATATFMTMAYILVSTINVPLRMR